MAQLWAVDDDRRWTVLPLGERAVRLDVRPLRPLRGGVRRDGIDAQVLIFPRESEADRAVRDDAIDREREWVLLAGARHAVRVNGYPLASGLRLLAHRDEVRVAGAGAVWFSTERLARVVEFPGSASPVQCARTKVALTPGMPAVRCPNCRTWYAQSERYPGWTYGASCVLCRRPTDLDAGFRWIPEGA